MISEKSRPYRVAFNGMEAIVFASSPGKARYRAALSLHDAGYLSRPNPSRVTAHRAPEFDHFACVDEGRCYDPSILSEMSG